MVFLRPIGENDRERMLDILTSDQVNKTYMLPDFEHREDALPQFHRLMTMSQNSNKYVRAIALEDGLIGFLNQVEVEDGSIELGYVIHPDFQGNGYMTQALNLAIEELFQMEYRQVITGAFTENTASIRVMEKSGMTRMDKIDEIDYRGKTHTCIYYSKKPMVFSCCFCGEAATAREAYVLSIARAHDPEGPEQDIYCHRICLERKIKDKNLLYIKYM